MTETLKQLRERVLMVDDEQPVDISLDDAAFQEAWKTWLYCNDKGKFDRDISLLTAIARYVSLSKRESVAIESDTHKLKERLERAREQLIMVRYALGKMGCTDSLDAANKDYIIKMTDKVLAAISDETPE